MSLIDEAIPGVLDGAHYPAEHDEPLAETGIHVDAIILFRVFLNDCLAGGCTW